MNGRKGKLLSVRVLSLFLVCFAGQQKSAYAGAWWLFDFGYVQNREVGNGIVVDPPKVFDDRSLVIMANQLDSTLAQINALDQTKILQSSGSLQGMDQASVSRAFSISTLPIPGLQSSQQLNTNNQLTTQETTSNAAFSPTIPSLPSQSLPALSQTGFSVSSSDILSEQMNLSYQVLNLRLLLERAMSDRIQRSPGAPKGPKAQGLLGFQVSIDPLNQHADEAAIVQVELTGMRNDAPSLVSLMPQAKTYNVAALSQKSTAFGASAVVKVVTLGYNEQHQAQSYYLYRDTDTVAFERQSTPKRLVFGWEFRPVLGRRTVEAGLRQLFAVVALDQIDDLASVHDFEVRAKIKTYWVKYDKDKAVIKSAPREMVSQKPKSVFIPCELTVKTALAPEIKDAKCFLVGQSNILINVEGNNFYTGSDVLLGDKILNTGNGGVVIKDDHLMQINANASDLLKSGVVIRGRYGLSSEVLDSANPPDEFKVSTEFGATLLSENNPLKLILKPRVGPNAPDLRNRLTIVSVGSQMFVLDPYSWHLDPATQTLKTTLPVKKENTQSNAIVNISVPLFPKARASVTLDEPIGADSLVVMRDADPQVWGIKGRGFQSLNPASTEIIAKAKYHISIPGAALPANPISVESDNLIRFEVPKSDVTEIKNISVVLNGLPSAVFPVPKPTPPDSKPALTGANPTAKTGSSPAITFGGTSLDQVTNVAFANTNLVFFQDSGGTKLHVFLTPVVTQKAVPVSLAVQCKDGAILVGNIDIND